MDLELVHVVVVEDTDDDAQITIRGLRSLNPEPLVRVIDDGASALAELAERVKVLPKLVFLDLKLPKVHGLDVLAAIKASPVSREIPVVVLTSSSEPRDISRAHELGCAEFLTKPIEWTEYIRLVCETAAKYIPGCVCKI